MPRAQSLYFSFVKLTFILSFTALTAPASSQELVPIGDQFQVNSVTSNSQSRPKVALAETGDFFIVWDSNAPPNAAFDVWGRRFDPDGMPLSSVFRINTTLADIQNEAALDIDATGAIAVAWEDGPIDDENVRARRFDAFDVPLDDEIAVNTYTTEDQESVAVALSNNGDMLVVWRSSASDGTDTDALSVHGQIYASDGSSVGANFEVNSITTGYQDGPQAAALPGGEFVVVWESAALGGPLGYTSSIQGQRFASDGSQIASEFQVSSDAQGLKSEADVAANAAGQFAVVWSHCDSTSGSPLCELRSQRFDAAATQIGGEFQVESLTLGDPDRPRIAVDAAGGFIVAWESDTTSGDDPDSSIQIRRFDLDGAAISPEMQVNSYTTDIQTRPDVAINDLGDVVVTWTSFGSVGDDDDVLSIQAQRLRIVGSLGGTVWLDDDNDGIFSAEESPLAGVEIELFDSSEVSQGTVTTDAGGDYLFGGLRPGAYRATFFLPAGAVSFSPQDIGDDDSVDSDVDTSGMTPLLTLMVGGSLDVDAGVFTDPVFSDGFEDGTTSAWTSTSP